MPVSLCPLLAQGTELAECASRTFQAKTALALLSKVGIGANCIYGSLLSGALQNRLHLDFIVDFLHVYTSKMCHGFSVLVKKKFCSDTYTYMYVCMYTFLEVLAV